LLRAEISFVLVRVLKTEKKEATYQSLLQIAGFKILFLKIIYKKKFLFLGVSLKINL